MCKVCKVAGGSGKVESPLCKQPYNTTHCGESDTVIGAKTLRQNAKTVDGLADGKRYLQAGSFADISP